MQDWSVLISAAVAFGVLFYVRRWAARHTQLRAGFILFAIGLPAFLAVRAVGATDVVQSDALIVPLIILPTAILLFSLLLIARGAFGWSRNVARRRATNNTR